MPRSSARDALISHVIATMSYVAYLFELSLDLGDVFPDADTHEVLLDQVDCAGSHLAGAIWTLNPQWQDLDRRAAETKALELFREHRPDIDETARSRADAIEALHDAIEEALEGSSAARCRGPQRRYRDVALELDYTVDHLENALYLLDPESFRRTLDATTPSQRVKLASRLEVIELELDESRARVRSRREVGLN
jgi:hypothetical protein